MTLTSAAERRLSLAILALLSVELTIALVVGPTRFMSVDDAKYLGIGVNLFAGRGPLTVFGAFFPYHSPLWPAVVVAPQAWFGMDALVWAHVVNLVSALAVLALTAWLGWRIRPAVGAIAACLLVAFGYFVALGHTLGLDLPAAALTLAYVTLGLTAVRRGSVPLALAAGGTFAVAFLVKEIALPFAPVPFLAGLVAARPPALVARLAACTMAVGLAGSAWWFVVYGQETGRVYRLGTPAWTLAPLAIAAGVLILLGWFAPRILAGRSSPGRGLTIAAGWAGCIAWMVMLTSFFAYTRISIGQPFLSVGQIAKYGSVWLDQLGVILAVGAVGAGLAVVEKVQRSCQADGAAIDDRQISAADDLLVTTLCGLPLVLLVVSVGELPRHYLAQAACLLVLGAAGWLWLLDRVLRRPNRTTLTLAVAAIAAAVVSMLPISLGRPALVLALGGIAVVGLALVVIGPLRRRLTPLASLAPVVIALVLTAGSSSALAAYSIRGPSILDDAKARAVATTADWIRANVPAGSRIAFAALLAYETADRLQDSYRSVQVRETQAVLFDPNAPLGLVVRGARPADDWIALGTSPNIVGVFYGYQAGRLEQQLKASGSSIWVVSTIVDGQSVTPIVQAVEHRPGIRVLAHWSWPYQPGTLETYVLGIEPASLSPATDRRLYVSQAALAGLIDLLRESGERGQAAARRLAARIVVVPDDPPGRQLEATLETLAGP